MASRGEKSGGDFVLESRHLVGLFLLLVVIFGVVFTLGYLLGRSQYDSSLRAATGKPAVDSSPGPAALPKSTTKADGAEAPPPASSDWDFYHSAEPLTTPDHLQTPKAAIAAAQPAAVTTGAPGSRNPATPPAKNSAKNAPVVWKGTIMLQIAAVRRRSDAVALSQALQQKKFPAVVVGLGTDQLYRVQVGPYADVQAAAAARRNLEAQGFKSIIKR